MRIGGAHPEASFMTTELAHGFYPVLMRYLPQLLCFEVKVSLLLLPAPSTLNRSGAEEDDGG
jgi:hypothetical protein